MKKNFLLAFAILCPFLIQVAVAQDDDTTVSEKTGVEITDIGFRSVKSTDNSLSESQKVALQKKVDKIIAKNNAGVTTECDAFGILADISIKDTKTSAGLVRNVTVLTAEISLTAMNIQDGSIYYTNSIDIEIDAVGNESKAKDKLISGIKVTDPQFVRFIRTARKRIAEWYNDHLLPLPQRELKEQK